MEPVQIPTQALLLVSDGRHARLIRNQGSPAKPQLVVERTLENVNPATRDQGTDRPGRKPGGDGVSRSAIEQTDWHQQEEQRFAAELAQLLYSLGHSGNFQSLIVIAPPKMLGDLRKQFHPEVSKALVAEVPKDLTSYSLPEIRDLLS